MTKVLMNSPFDRDKQQEQTHSKLIVALEKLSESFRVLLWEQTKTHGLSPIQVQILIYLNHHGVEQAKPAVLASEFNVTRPTISDALNALKKKDLLEARPNPADSRSRLLFLSPKAVEICTKVEQYANPLLEALTSLDPDAQSDLLFNLLKVINRLETSQVINAQRMCLNCAYYEGDGKEAHYCTFLDRNLSKGDLRIDCPEHRAA